MTMQVTTIDQDSGEVGKQPLIVLKDIRTGEALGWSKESWQKEAFFGWNVVNQCTGRIKAGEELKVIHGQQPM